MIDIEMILDRLPSLYGTGWEYSIAGSQTYGIEGTGSRWSPIKGTQRFNDDAFIVIRKITKVESSTAPLNTTDKISD